MAQVVVTAAVTVVWCASRVPLVGPGDVVFDQIHVLHGDIHVGYAYEDQ